MKSIGEIIKEKRLETGLSQRAFAKRLGVSNIAVGRWEKGDYLPSILNCWDLADLFGCTIDELCGRTLKGEKTNE